MSDCDEGSKVKDLSRSFAIEMPFLFLRDSVAQSRYVSPHGKSIATL
jgi:hypothetical protein